MILEAERREVEHETENGVPPSLRTTTTSPHLNSPWSSNGKQPPRGAAEKVAPSNLIYQAPQHPEHCIVLFVSTLIACSIIVSSIIVRSIIMQGAGHTPNPFFPSASAIHTIVFSPAPKKAKPSLRPPKKRQKILSFFPAR